MNNIYTPTYHTSGYATLSNLDFKIIHCTGSNKKRCCLVNIIIIVINPLKTSIKTSKIQKKKINHAKLEKMLIINNAFPYI